jgi:diguanylate cyclase (GGDEF)-like protein
MYPENEATRMEALRSLALLDTSPEERFDRITRLARKLFGVGVSVVSLIDTDRQWFKSRAGNFPITETARSVSFCGHTILGDDVLHVENALLDERFFDNPLVVAGGGIRFYAGHPIRSLDGSKIGSLCVIDQEPRSFDDSDKRALRDLAYLLEQELAISALATTDDLTLLPNRRGFELQAYREMCGCGAQRRPACALFFDLDRFKRINDTFGHAEGDRALVAFSDVLKGIFRQSDVVGRLSGDEFAAFLPDCSVAQVNEILARVDESVSRYNRDNIHDYEFGYSVGVVKFDPAKHGTVGDLLKEADAKMYEHKRRRRLDAA